MVGPSGSETSALVKLNFKKEQRSGAATKSRAKEQKQGRKAEVGPRGRRRHIIVGAKTNSDEQEQGDDEVRRPGTGRHSGGDQD